MKSFPIILNCLVVAMSLFGCNWFLDDSLGQLNGPCFDDLTCNDPLLCNQEHICIEDESDQDSDGDLDQDLDSGDGDLEVAEDDNEPIGEGPAEIQWVRILASSIQMGCVEKDEDCLSAEKPQHEVILADFDIMVKELSNAQAGILIEVIDNGPPPENHDCPDCPIVNIAWNEAWALCQLAGGKLPSEAQWEAAARAAKKSVFVCGDNEACLDTSAWYSDNADGFLHPGGELFANAFGLYDISGNAAEWISDSFHENYDGAPDDGTSWDEDDTTLRVVRGGSYKATPSILRLSYRSGLDPLQGYEQVGVRCVRDAR
jgi:formylglycine-generating enzyme required for sulfatase activity